MVSSTLNNHVLRPAATAVDKRLHTGSEAGDTQAGGMRRAWVPTRAAHAERLSSPLTAAARAAKAAADDDAVTNPTVDQRALIEQYAREIELTDGTPARLRPILPQDKANLQSGLSRMSEDARYRRFMSTMSELPPGMLRQLTEIDYDNHFALGALALDHNPPRGIGVARYVRDPDNPHVAEPAVTVVDAYQGLGLGRQLLEQLMVDALDHGITHFRATLLADNKPMKQLFAQQGAQFKHEGCGELSAEFALPELHYSRTELVHQLVRHARAGAAKRAGQATPQPASR